jgi:phage terminase large subunit GpA-like protein
MREPMDALANPDAREIVVMAPIGTGKSTMLEAACCYIVSEDSGPTLIVAQTDADLQDWAETRLDFAMKNTEDTRILYPRDRYKAGKMKVLFPHMPMFLTGANLSGLQAKSMRRVLCDEVWAWKKGMLNQARGRLHDRWNRQIFIMSQGGTKGDDLDAAFDKSTAAEFSFCCPKCAREQRWKLANLKWDWVETDGKRDPVKSSQTARIVCDNPECDFVIEDSPVIRRELTQSARYVPTKEGSQGHFGYRYNVLCNWRKPLREIAELYIDALLEKDRGNIEPLKQFIQKRLAEPWEERVDENIVQLSGSGYSLAEFANGEIWEGELERNMTIDRQQDHYWTRIRAFRANGDSRLLFCAKVNTEQMLRDIQLRYKVPDKVVGIDARYDSAHVYDLCAKYDWTALDGLAYR